MNEELGQVEYIFSDKTGTLTTNQMTVTDFFVVGKDKKSLSKFEVSGDSFEPKGDVSKEGGDAFALKADPAVAELAKICTMCNESGIEYSDGKYSKIGEATEAALLVLVEKLNVHGHGAHDAWNIGGIGIS